MARSLRNILTLCVLVAVIAAVGNSRGDLQTQVGADFDQFSSLLGKYLTLVQTNADLNELTQKSQKLKTILFN